MEKIISFLLGLLTKQKLKSLGANDNDPSFTMTYQFKGSNTEGPPEGLEESRDILHCEPELQSAWPLIQQRFKTATGKDLFLTCTYRSRKKQNELWQLGRSIPGKIVTKLDGINQRSRHNHWPSQAIDVCIDRDLGPGKILEWDPVAYSPLGPICDQLNLRWGGDWNRNGDSSDESFIDAPHIELC